MSYRVAAMVPFVTTALLISVQPAPIAAQTPVPRTPWGAPDLHGTWSVATTTPLERPAELAGRHSLHQRRPLNSRSAW